MKKVHGLALGRILLAALGLSLIAAGIAHAKTDFPIFTGEFTLVTPVRWNTLVLRPGVYTVTIENEVAPSFAIVKDSEGHILARLMCQIVNGQTSGRNALLIREKDRQFRVYSLSLGSLGKILVYDPALAREATLEARAPQTVPVVLAKQ